SNSAPCSVFRSRARATGPTRPSPRSRRVMAYSEWMWDRTATRSRVVGEEERTEPLRTMGRQPMRTLRWVLAAIVLSQAPTSSAGDTFHDVSVDAALKSPSASGLRKFPIFMAGQDHPPGDKIEDSKSNRRTNAFGKSDEDACAIAFLSAIFALQDRALAVGGTAVVDITSVTKNDTLTSATEYRCVAGAMIANVALTGTIIKGKQ